MDDSNQPAERSAFLPAGSGLYVILAVAVLLSCVVLAMALRHDRNWESDLGPGSRAYGPEDYADRFPAELERSDFAEQGGTFPVPPPPITEEYWRCSKCHDEDLKQRLARRARPRELKGEHETIVLNHGDKDRWCFDCHNPEDRDTLRLANGKTVEFTESYKLCGQCHGTIYRDWKAGIHGRRRGWWDGPKQYMLCAHCHDPHSPRFKKRTPMGAPVRPDRLSTPK
jgi:hypothetical protein